MKTRLLLAAGLVAVLGGCATYDYAGGEGGGYYRGTPGVQYRYNDRYGPYYGGYGYPYGGYGWSYPYYYGGGYYSRPVRPLPPSRPPHGGRPPDHRPPHHRPPQNRPPQGERPPPRNGGNRSPWRNMDGLRRPQNSSDARPAPRQVPRPAAAPRPQGRPRPASRPGRSATVSTQER